MDETKQSAGSAISSRLLLLLAILGVLAIAEAAMLGSVRQESQTSDEAYNLFGGYVYLTAGNFSIASAHPPLAKDVGALPLLALHPILPRMTQAEVSDFRSGRIFLYSNSAAKILFAARAAMTVFPLLLAVLVFLATWEMFGIHSAFIALVLMALEPNFLAHGALVTNDVALAVCIFATVYAFWRYVVKHSAWRLATCGVAAGMTLAAKHSGIIIFLILFLLALVELIHPEEDSHQGISDNEIEAEPGLGDRPTTAMSVRPIKVVGIALRLALALLAVIVVSIFVLWGFYGFHYSPIAGTPAPSMAPLLDQLPNRHTAAALALVARIHLLPEAFLDGLGFLFATDSRPTYLLGERYVHGVWFYFPIVMVIKSTLGFLFLLALAPFARNLRERRIRREVLWMVIPAAVFMVAGMTSKLDIGVRHILPVYPFLCILAAVGAASLASARRVWLLVVAGALAIHAASSLSAYPNFLSYSNELWGGPSKTYRVLSDSNVDWGQGLPAASAYLVTRSGRPCWMAYFGSVDPAYYGIPCQQMPVHEASIWECPLDVIPPEIQGNILISATEMSGQLWGPGEINPYEQFRSFLPGMPRGIHFRLSRKLQRPLGIRSESIATDCGFGQSPRIRRRSRGSAYRRGSRAAIG